MTKIPIELASMVGDFRGIIDVKSVERRLQGKTQVDTFEIDNEYNIYCTYMHLGAMEYLREHGYEVTGVDLGDSITDSGFIEEYNSYARLWVKKNE